MAHGNSFFDDLTAEAAETEQEEFPLEKTLSPDDQFVTSSSRSIGSCMKHLFLFPQMV